MSLTLMMHTLKKRVFGQKMIFRSSIVERNLNERKK